MKLGDRYKESLHSSDPNSGERQSQPQIKTEVPNNHNGGQYISLCQEDIFVKDKIKFVDFGKNTLNSMD